MSLLLQDAVDAMEALTCNDVALYNEVVDCLRHALKLRPTNTVVDLLLAAAKEHSSQFQGEAIVAQGGAGAFSSVVRLHDEARERMRAGWRAHMTRSEARSILDSAVAHSRSPRTDAEYDDGMREQDRYKIALEVLQKPANGTDLEAESNGDGHYDIGSSHDAPTIVNRSHSSDDADPRRSKRKRPERHR